MAEEQTAEKRLSIGKIYLKDFSFESPQSPDVFRQGDWKPQTDLNLRSSHTAISETEHEIVLTITIQAKEGDKTFFLVELQQAGLFDPTMSWLASGGDASISIGAFSITLGDTTYFYSTDGRSSIVFSGAGKPRPSSNGGRP